jgi:hypothetical protein
MLDKGHLQGELAGMALLKNGTYSGAHAIIFRVNMPDGTIVTAETTLKLFAMAFMAFKARSEMQGQML